MFWVSSITKVAVQVMQASEIEEDEIRLLEEEELRQKQVDTKWQILMRARLWFSCLLSHYWMKWP